MHYSQYSVSMLENLQYCRSGKQAMEKLGSVGSDLTVAGALWLP